MGIAGSASYIRKDATRGRTASNRTENDVSADNVEVAAVEHLSREIRGLARLIGHRFQNPCDGMRNARLKREDAFSHAMIIVSSAMVSSS